MSLPPSRTSPSSLPSQMIRWGVGTKLSTLAARDSPNSAHAADTTTDSCLSNAKQTRPDSRTCRCRVKHFRRTHVHVSEHTNHTGNTRTWTRRASY